MFAVGHFSIGYLFGKFFAKLLKIQISVPLILVLSIIPDIDIILEMFIGYPIHRGPIHSILFAFMLLLPFFILFGKRVLPYFFSLASHSVIADFFIGGNIQLFWPLTESKFGASNYGFSLINIDDPANIALEIVIFILALLIMIKTKDFLNFFRSNLNNLFLIIPVITVLLPTFTSYPLSVPDLLIYPHLFYLLLFSIAGLIALKKFFW